MIRLVRTSVLLAIGQVWANKLRSMLATLGIVIGIASVVAVIAALTGLERRVLADFEKFGANSLILYPSRPSEGPMRNAPWDRINLSPDETDGLLDAAPAVATFTRAGAVSDEVTVGAVTTDEAIEIIGIDAAWHRIARRSVIAGRPFGVVDELNARPVCLVTAATVRSLGLPPDPVGQALQTLGRRFTIVGVVEPNPSGSTFGRRGEREEVFVPYPTLVRMARPQTSLDVLANSPAEVAQAEGELRHFFRQKRGLAPTDPDTFGIFKLAQVIEDFQALAAAVTAVAAGIVSISLLVGGVGIMNIMLVSVSERTREIGLRKAVGATPAALLLQFLVEAVVLCTLGGLVGLLCGQGLVLLLRRIPEAGLEAAGIPAWAAALSLGFSSSVGVAFGFLPALKAARLDPIEALRHE